MFGSIGFLQMFLATGHAGDEKIVAAQFLGIGFPEMLLIAGLALVVIGPEQFPSFAKMAIRTVRDLRGYFEDIRSEAIRELNPLKKEMDDLSRVDPEKYIDSLTGEGDVKPEPSAGTPGFTDSYAMQGGGNIDPSKEDSNPYGGGYNAEEDTDGRVDPPYSNDMGYREPQPGEAYTDSWSEPATPPASRDEYVEAAEAPAAESRADSEDAPEKKEPPLEAPERLEG